MTPPPTEPSATSLSRSAHVGLADQLAERFAGPIRQRLLAPGSRLPSVRECARRHGVSAHTVVAAYDQLLALGLVEARPQRGFFVRSRGAASEAPATRDAPATAVPRHPLPISATSLIRGMFQPPGARPMPGLGTLPAEWLDPQLLARALRQVTSAGQLATSALHYGDPAGDPRLRRALAARLGEHGIDAGVAQIVTSVGATHALDIVTRTLLRAGDRVLVDEPGWSVEYARLAALGLVILPVPRGDDGPDLAVMERLIEAQPAGAKPRLYVTVSVLHNPTGATLTPGSAHKLLQLATRHDLHVVEDDTYAHLAPPHLPRLSALDGLERTIYVSGFSKILVPNWRIGFLAAPEQLIERLVDTKLLTTLTSPGLTEQALAQTLESGQLRRHAERVVAKLDAARARVVKLAQAHGCRFAATPRGLFGWVDAGCDSERLAEAMLDHWLIAPGALFHAQHRPTTLMRINFATSQDATFWRALVEARAALGASPAPAAA